MILSPTNIVSAVMDDKFKLKTLFYVNSPVDVLLTLPVVNKQRGFSSFFHLLFHTWQNVQEKSAATLYALAFVVNVGLGKW